MKVKEVIKIAEDNGWVHVRTTGDHRIFIKPGARRPLVIPGHLNSDMPTGTEKSALRTIRGG